MHVKTLKSVATQSLHNDSSQWLYSFKHEKNESSELGCWTMHLRQLSVNNSDCLRRILRLQALAWTEKIFFSDKRRGPAPIRAIHWPSWVAPVMMRQQPGNSWRNENDRRTEENVRSAFKKKQAKLRSINDIGWENVGWETTNDVGEHPRSTETSDRLVEIDSKRPIYYSNRLKNLTERPSRLQENVDAAVNSPVSDVSRTSNGQTLFSSNSKRPGTINYCNVSRFNDFRSNDTHVPTATSGTRNEGQPTEGGADTRFPLKSKSSTLNAHSAPFVPSLDFNIVRQAIFSQTIETQTETSAQMNSAVQTDDIFAQPSQGVPASYFMTADGLLVGLPPTMFALETVHSFLV